jgi:hypothetical protein
MDAKIPEQRVTVKAPEEVTKVYHMTNSAPFSKFKE